MLSRIQFSLIGDLGIIPEYADHMTLVSAANMADWDPAEHMVIISKRSGKRKNRKINTEQLAVMFSVSSEIIVLLSFLAFGQVKHMQFVFAFFKHCLDACLFSYKYSLCYSLKKALFIWWRSSVRHHPAEWPNKEGRFNLSGFSEGSYFQVAGTNSSGVLAFGRSSSPDQSSPPSRSTNRTFSPLFRYGNYKCEF